MGYKQYFQIGEDKFKEFYNNSENYGDLAPYQLTVEGAVHYGVGVTGSGATGWKLTPKVQHYIGKTRITVKYYLYATGETSGHLGIGIVFYTDGDTAKDQNGNDIFGAEHSYTNSNSGVAFEEHTLTVEQENNTITYYVDGNKVGSATLNGNLTKFAIGVEVIDVTQVVVEGAESAGSDIEMGVILTNITAEYYDQMEDIINSLISVFNLMIPIMMIIIVVGIMFKAFKKKK